MTMRRSAGLPGHFRGGGLSRGNGQGWPGGDRGGDGGASRCRHFGHSDAKDKRFRCGRRDERAYARNAHYLLYGQRRNMHHRSPITPWRRLRREERGFHGIGAGRDQGAVAGEAGRRGPRRLAAKAEVIESPPSSEPLPPAVDAASCRVIVGGVVSADQDEAARCRFYGSCSLREADGRQVADDAAVEFRVGVAHDVLLRHYRGERRGERKAPRFKIKDSGSRFKCSALDLEPWTLNLHFSLSPLLSPPLPFLARKRYTTVLAASLECLKS